MNKNILASFMRTELVEAGELMHIGGDYFEDMGGHIVHESLIVDYFKNYIRGLSKGEQLELLERMGTEFGAAPCE